jgi:hypothetical protein
MNTEQRAREILAEVTGAHVENIADFANDTSGGVTVTVPDALRAIIRALSPPASANPNAGKPELCGCGLPAEYMTNDGGWCCNKYGIKHLPASAGEVQIGEFVIAMLIAAGYVTQAKVDEARKIALSHGPYEMAAPTPPATAQEDGRDAARYRWLRDQGMGFAHDEEHRGISTMRWGEWALDTAEGFANQIDAAIDAAMLTSPDSGKEG